MTTCLLNPAAEPQHLAEGAPTPRAAGSHDGTPEGPLCGTQSFSCSPTGIQTQRSGSGCQVRCTFHLPELGMMETGR